MENNPIRPPHNPASAPVMPPGPSALENQKTPPPTSPLSKGEPQHPFPIPAGNRPTEPESKHFWKSKWFILIILLLIILIPATIFAAAKITSKPAPISSPEPSAQTTTPAPDPTASWKTYSSNIGGFSIKSPEDYELSNTIDTFPSLTDAEKVSGNHFSLMSNYGTISNPEGVPVTELKLEARVFSNFNKSLDEWINDEWGSDIIKSEKILIDGKSAKKVWGRSRAGQVSQVLQIYFIDGNKAITIYAWPYNSNYLNIFDQMVSTFKFTDSDETASWKTYSGTGFEIKYPSDLYSTETGNGLHVLEPTTSFNNQKPLAATYSVTVAPFQKKSDMTLQDPYSLFGNGIALQYTKDLITDKTIQNITIGGLKALRIDEIPAGQAGNGSEIYTISGNTVYEIVISPQQVTGDPEKNKALYEKILSTFKFTK